jgi:hypothetical protein
MAFRESHAAGRQRLRVTCRTAPPQGNSDVLDPDLRYRIPDPVMQILIEVLADALPPAGIDRLALLLTPGVRRPRGNRRSKARTWLHAVNADPSIAPLRILGQAIAALPAEYLDAPRPDMPQCSNRLWLEARLHDAGLRFVPPDGVVRIVG